MVLHALPAYLAAGPQYFSVQSNQEIFFSLAKYLAQQCQLGDEVVAGEPNLAHLYALSKGLSAAVSYDYWYVVVTGTCWETLAGLQDRYESYAALANGEACSEHMLMSASILDHMVSAEHFAD